MIKLTDKQRKRLKSICNQSVAMDNKWITVKPNGPDNKGKHVEIDDNGRVVKGMGGKFSGEKISEIRKSFTGPKTPKEINKNNESSSKKENREQSLEKKVTHNFYINHYMENGGNASPPTKEQEKTHINLAKKIYKEITSSGSSIGADLVKMSNELINHSDKIYLSSLFSDKEESEFVKAGYIEKSDPHNRYGTLTKKGFNLLKDVAASAKADGNIIAPSEDVKKTFTEPPPLPKWYEEIRSKHSNPYWNGKYYKGKRKGEHRIYVSNKEYSITDQQKQELEQHRKDWQAFKEQQQSRGTYLNVPYEQRELAKQYGAKWNPDRKQWYLPEGVELAKEIEHFSPDYKKPISTSTTNSTKSNENRYFGARVNVDINTMNEQEAVEHLNDLYAGRDKYNKIMNEGGEGYNPFDADIEIFNKAFIKKFRPDYQKFIDKQNEARKKEREQKLAELEEKVKRNRGWYPD